MGLLVFAAVVASACLGGGSDSEQDSSAGNFTQRIDGDAAGLLMLGDEYVEPPFEVAATETQVTINGVVVRSHAVESSEPAAPPEEARDANDAIAIVSARFRELGGASAEAPDDEVTNELLELARSLPVVASAAVEEGELSVEDSEGLTSTLFLQLPPRASDEQIAAGMSEVAAVWAEHLEGGGALLFDGNGASLMVPTSDAAEFVASIDEALGSSDAEAALAELAGTAVGGALLLVGEPPASVRARIGESVSTAARRIGPSQPGPLLVSADPRAPQLSLAEASGEHRDSRTPRAREAWIYTPFQLDDWCPEAAVMVAAAEHGYWVYSFDKQASTVERFYESSGRAGILWYCAHGGSRNFGIEEYDDRNDAALRASELRGTLDPGIGNCTTTLQDCWVVTIQAANLRAHWVGMDTIVHAMSCYGQTLAGVFLSVGVRVHIGPQVTVCPAWQGSEETDFWGRMSGTAGNGEHRNHIDAFENGPYDPNVWIHTGDGRTVLSPGVVEVAPTGTIEVGERTAGMVEFDVPVFNDIQPLIEITGGTCEATIANPRWADLVREPTYTGAKTALFDITATTPGQLTLRMRSLGGASAANGALLDGNETPPTDHVGPNGDHHSWVVDCVVGEGTPSAGDQGTGDFVLFLGGTVYLDRDGDGEFREAAGDEPIEGAEVQLIETISGAIRETKTTNARGIYVFEALRSDDVPVQVRVLPVDGRPFSPPPAGEFLERPSSVDAAGYSIDLFNPGDYDGHTNLSVNAAVSDPLPIRLSGLVYFDQDRDGLFSAAAGDERIPGVDVELLDAVSGEILETAITDGDGIYEFRVEQYEQVRIRVLSPDALPFSPPGSGSADQFPSSVDRFGTSIEVIDLESARGLDSSGLLDASAGVDTLSEDVRSALEDGPAGVTMGGALALFVADPSSAHACMTNLLVASVSTRAELDALSDPDVRNWPASLVDQYVEALEECAPLRPFYTAIFGSFDFADPACASIMTELVLQAYPWRVQLEQGVLDPARRAAGQAAFEREVSQAYVDTGCVGAS